MERQAEDCISQKILHIQAKKEELKKEPEEEQPEKLQNIQEHMII